MPCLPSVPVRDWFRLSPAAVVTGSCTLAAGIPRAAGGASVLPQTSRDDRLRFKDSSRQRLHLRAGVPSFLVDGIFVFVL